jgi:hypothetical protein
MEAKVFPLRPIQTSMRKSINGQKFMNQIKIRFVKLYLMGTLDRHLWDIGYEHISKLFLARMKRKMYGQYELLVLDEHGC